MPAKTQQLQIRVTAEEKAAVERAAARANLDMSAWVLRKLFPPAAKKFRVLTNALEDNPATARYTLAELNDLLTGLSASAFVIAVAEPPARLSDAYLVNYVAAMVETAANLKSVRPPDWTGTVAPLPTPSFASELQSLRLHLLLAAPPAFRRRNLFVDASIGDRV